MSIDCILFYMKLCHYIFFKSASGTCFDTSYTTHSYDYEIQRTRAIFLRRMWRYGKSTLSKKKKSGIYNTSNFILINLKMNNLVQA